MFDDQIPPGWEHPFEMLRKKWKTIPSGNDLRAESASRLQLTDTEVLEKWRRAHAHDTVDEGFGIRGWYHEIYRTFMRGKKVLDIGCGMALSTIPFAEMGADLTFVDIVADNVRLVERLCKLKGIKANFLHMEDLESLASLPRDYDVVTAVGSLINAPLAVTKREIDVIKLHLRPGGRWLHFAYPRSRWEREGSVEFSKWGEMTDGPGTPWMEFHDREKMEWLFSPSKIRILFECEWHNNDFNWFDIELSPPIGEQIAHVPFSALSAQNGGTITASQGGVDVHTAPQQWAYSALAPLTSGTLPAGKLVLRVMLQVTQGQVGIAVATQDISAPFIAEVGMGPSALPRIAEIAIPDGEKARFLVIRNWAPTERSVAHLSDITVFRPEASSP
ncbi:Methyltransferase domain-containing protein [Rhizobiales bacterium GAS113]|nr:Methyltransferase domain-containing protein [Rhizobiales bacterium GAS113]